MAELIPLQKISTLSGFTHYGIVSDGNLWQFGKLTDNLFVQDTTSFTLNNTLNNIEILFGALVFIFEQMQDSLE